MSDHRPQKPSGNSDLSISTHQNVLTSNEEHSRSKVIVTKRVCFVESASSKRSDVSFVSSSVDPVRKLWSKNLGDAIFFIMRRLLGIVRIFTLKTTSSEVERRTFRYVPRSLEHLLSVTKFNKDELKLLYRNFKNDCPNGIINEDLCKRIFGQFFSNKGSDMFAHLVFRAFDHHDEGFINFEEFAIGLSKLLRGDLSDKLLWTFKLYDLNQDGFISKNFYWRVLAVEKYPRPTVLQLNTDGVTRSMIEFIERLAIKNNSSSSSYHVELFEVVKSIYMLLGSHSENGFSDEMIEQHTARIFDKFDRNHDDVITVDEFFETCSNNEEIVRFMTAFDSAI